MSHRRALYPSEAMFAANRSTVAYSVFGTGRLDRTALAIAFEALLRAYPVLAAKLVPGGPGWLLEPAAGRPALRDSAVTDIPPGGFHVLEADAVCALDVVQGRGEFRLTLLTHHSIADATASLGYLQRLCELYTETVTAEAGTVIQGVDTAGVMVARDDDPIRLRRAVLEGLDEAPDDGVEAGRPAGHRDQGSARAPLV